MRNITEDLIGHLRQFSNDSIHICKKKPTIILTVTWIYHLLAKGFICKEICPKAECINTYHYDQLLCRFSFVTMII